ncbi:helix-turn-helix transcriptional regulator [Nocardioides dongkuii]|uniref:helix-turn-helix transcriptional regulator n=1 Tax=Nocardioides dongkuii TaxID=2760089 RepID=UPI0015F7C739|nr:response regulator transcription factor [Nocardioides dongkuii]
MSSPVRVAVADDYAVVVAGVASALQPHADRVQVVELDSRVPLESDVDILLYDSFGQPQADDVDVDVLANGRASKVVAFSWNVEPELVQRALDRGMAGYIPKRVSAEELVGLLERVHAGERVVPDVPIGEGGTFGSWPGRDHGLTDREAEILALITQGLSNQEIAGRVYLGINTVKTHIRNAYRKIGVERRPQAVRWGIEHGFQPDEKRQLPQG